MANNSIINTKGLAKRIRIHALRMTSMGGCSHIGSAFSIADIVAVLYGGILNVDPRNPRDPARDRFILSKGHAGTIIYAVLAERDFFDIKKLESHCQDGSDLSGHVSHHGIPGVELSTGSLGHGLGVGVGMAYAAKIRGDEHKTVILLSDGECDEGSTWEAILFAGHHKLNNIIAVVDYNKIQSLAPISETIALEPFVDKWKSFGWTVAEVDGHDHVKLNEVFAKVYHDMADPTVVIAHTVKGKGVSFMENSVLWHYRCPRGEEYAMALSELEAMN